MTNFDRFLKEMSELFMRYNENDVFSRRLSLLAVVFFIFVSVVAVPARRGIWKTLTLSGGKSVRATLCGDEAAHYWQSEEGKKYVLDVTTGTYHEVEEAVLRSRRLSRVSKAKGVMMSDVSPAPSFVSTCTGEKRGLFVLVEFADKSFASGHDWQSYEKIVNEKNFSSSDGFVGSIHDYFSAQSYGALQLTFDVVGPVKLSHNYAYYGGNDNYGVDKHPGEMVAEACKSIAGSVDLADYDWDGDGTVDMLFVLYAGEGEASSSDEDTVWPHKSSLSYSDYNDCLSIGGYTIDGYSCANELFEDNYSGIGNICHEISHVLGLYDSYDTSSGGNYGMGSWDLMDSGSYNGNSFVPAGYTSFERMSLGWLSPVVLGDDVSVEHMKPLTSSPEAYVIYNPANKNEFYLLENRQDEDWDSGLPAKGMLVMHVDYDESVWNGNAVNNKEENDHQHMTIFHADDDDDTAYWNNIGHYYFKTTEATDLYPYNGNDSLTNNSVPAASLYNANTDGRKFMNVSVKNIRQNADATMAFDFLKTSAYTEAEEPDVVFHETFDNCSGTGGNDGLWTGRIALSKFNPDCDGWSSNYMYGGKKCARFNSSTSHDVLVSPKMSVNGPVDIVLRMAPWGDQASDVNIWYGDKILDSPMLTPGKWTTVTLHTSYSGTTRLQFVADKRFFIDDVLVKRGKSTDIQILPADADVRRNGRIYTLSGQYAGTDLRTLPKGIYIKDGKKIVRE